MSATFLATAWEQIGAGMGNHLWQSTVFAIVAALLTFALRKNHAQARYWIWLAASVKFLVPFAPLVALGQRMTWLRQTAEASSGFSMVIEEAGRPFTQALPHSAAAAPAASSAAIQWLPMALAVWLCGFAAVIVAWCLCWRRVSAAIRRATPLREGREVEALRRLERITNVGTRIEMMLSRTMLEPGIFGLSRPVLVWPEGISQHLENQHLDAIIAHELWHVRRRDNLWAALHMIVEALFWFHPVVWWVGARLVDERERACDEKVLESGKGRAIYAESILKVCEFCVGSPLACVSGVTGSDLKKRMVHIMSENIAGKLDFSKKLLLSIVAVLAIATPIVFGLFDATPSRAQSQAENSSAAVPAFQSFSIKPADTSAPRPNPLMGGAHVARMMYGPDGFVADNVTMQSLIEEAYGVQASQISGPSDLLNATYDVAAKVDPSAGTKFSMMGADKTQSQQMLQAALADRTKLVLHHETKVLPVYALVVAADGAKLQPSPSTGSAVDGAARPTLGTRLTQTPDGNRQVVNTALGVSVDVLAQQLSKYLGITVIDKTGLKGKYDFNLKWIESRNQVSDATGSKAGSADPGASDASLFAAIQQQLGLKLEAQKQPLDVLVIDHIETPSEN
jgi:bla regulator protein blaR1